MDFNSMVTAMVEAFKGGHWTIFASACVMCVVWCLTKAPFASVVIKNGKAKVWTAAICGVVAAAAAVLMSGGTWSVALMSGFQVGLGATGLFELINRTIAKKPIDANNDGVLDA